MAVLRNKPSFVLGVISLIVGPVLMTFGLTESPAKSASTAIYKSTFFEFVSHKLPLEIAGAFLLTMGILFLTGAYDKKGNQNRTLAPRTYARMILASLVGAWISFWAVNLVLSNQVRTF